MSTESINELLNLIRTKTKQIIGENLKEAILYGSYARGSKVKRMMISTWQT